MTYGIREAKRSNFEKLYEGIEKLHAVTCILLPTLFLFVVGVLHAATSERCGKFQSTLTSFHKHLDYADLFALSPSHEP